MTGRRYLLYGASALAVGVAEALVEAGHQVVVFHSGTADEELLQRLPASALARSCSLTSPPFREELRQCECLLALEEEDQVNLKVALQAHRLIPELPVVIRTFDPTMAEALEEGVNVRRAFSLSAIAAPFFVADLLAEELLTSLNLAGQQVTVCRLVVESGSSLQGLSGLQLEEKYHCIFLDGPDGAIAPGSTLIFGGLQVNVLNLASLNHPPEKPKLARKEKPEPERRTRTESQLGLALRTLLAVLAISVVVFAWALHLDPVDAVYFVITTATTTGYGDISLKDSPAWLKLFGCVVMLAGGGLVAVLFSHLSALVSQDRLEERMEKQARLMSGHVILAGLGRIGYRVEQLLSALRIPCVVLDPQGSRFSSATRTRSVVLKGDARVPEDLKRAGLSRARAFVGCTDNDLLNLQCCLQAKKLNPDLYTQVRIQDRELAESIGPAFKLNSVMNPVQLGIGAFVGAATGERALRRLRIGEQNFLAFRWRVPAQLEPETLQAWRNDRVFVLAVEVEDEPRMPKPDAPIPAQSWVILVGQESSLRRLSLL